MISKLSEALGKAILSSKGPTPPRAFRPNLIIGEIWPSLSSIEIGISVGSIPIASTEEQFTEPINQELMLLKIY
jgi:hypothetical protein